MYHAGVSGEMAGRSFALAVGAVVVERRGWSFSRAAESSYLEQGHPFAMSVQPRHWNLERGGPGEVLCMPRMQIHRLAGVFLVCGTAWLGLCVDEGL